MPDHRLGLRTVGTPSLKEGVGGSFALHLSVQPLLPAMCMQFCQYVTSGLGEGLESIGWGRLSGGGGGAGEPAYMLGEDFPVQLPWGHSL